MSLLFDHMCMRLPFILWSPAGSPGLYVVLPRWLTVVPETPNLLRGVPRLLTTIYMYIYIYICIYIYWANLMNTMPHKLHRKWRQNTISDISFGDWASSCTGRLSIGNMQRHTPWVLDWVPLDPTSHVETDCIIQDQ